MNRGRKIVSLAILLAIAAIGSSCNKDDRGDAIRVIMQNNTGQHMTLFVLDYGTGKIQYEIFSRDYTFAENIQPPPQQQTISVKFHDDSGKVTKYDLDRPLTPEMAGGVLRVYFKEGGKHQMSFEFPE